MSTDRSKFSVSGNTSLMSQTGKLMTFIWFAAGALILAAVLLQWNTDSAKKKAQDADLRSLATREVASLDNYFEEARKLNLIGASDVAYQNLLTTARDPWNIVHKGGSAQVDAVNTAMANFHTLYPDAIGEACLIAFNGHEVARVVGADRAPVGDLSDDESGSPMFKPTFALQQGEVYQAAPYFSPDMNKWVISNSTLVPWTRGASPAFVHFEVELASFQRNAKQLAGNKRIQIVDATSGKVIVDTAKEFKEVETQLGSKGKPYASLVSRERTNVLTTKGDLRIAMRKLEASNPHNANKWYVAATAPVVATGILHPTMTALMLLVVAGMMIAFNTVVRKAVIKHVSRIDRLVEVTTAAAANADLDVRISDGMDDELGHLGDSFETILGSMRQATATARRIAAGDIHAKVSTRSEGDALGQAFAEMQKYLFHMAEVADSIASGNLNTRFEVKGKDDELGMSFLKMQEKLRSGIGDVSASSQQLSSSSHMLASTSTELTSGIEGVADSVTAIVAAVDEYSTLVARTRESAEEAMTAASHAGALTKSGMDAAGEARQAMDELRHASAGVTEAIRELAGRSTQITSIVDTITDISEQTNLLALNAAIEAARAGEHGRGFAVVADEVRKLAEESGQAAQMIAKIVAQINADTDRTVAIVGETAQSTESGAKVVDAASDALREISTSVNEVVGSVSTIRSATDEVATVISSTAESIVQVSAVTQQAAASMVEVADSARSLSSLATTLEDVTSQFTIGDDHGRPALRRVA